MAIDLLTGFTPSNALIPPPPAGTKKGLPWTMLLVASLIFVFIYAAFTILPAWATICIMASVFGAIGYTVFQSAMGMLDESRAAISHARAELPELKKWVAEQLQEAPVVKSAVQTFDHASKTLKAFEESSIETTKTLTSINNGIDWVGTLMTISGGLFLAHSYGNLSFAPAMDSVIASACIGVGAWKTLSSWWKKNAPAPTIQNAPETEIAPLAPHQPIIGVAHVNTASHSSALHSNFITSSVTPLSAKPGF